MKLGKNKFKQGLKTSDTQIGLWSSLCSNISAEILAYAGFDWIVLDMEHAPNEVPMVLSQMQALGLGGSSVVVRPPWNDMVTIKRVLDCGAQSLLIPYVQSVEEAEQAVAFTRYPPQGVRGAAGGTRATAYGRITDYMDAIHDELCVIVQVETIEALNQVEAIAQVEGVDGIFIGPSDLSASMGHLGNPGHEAVQAQIKGAAQRLANTPIASGILGTKPEFAERYVQWGFDFVAVGNDAGVLSSAVDQLRAQF